MLLVFRNLLCSTSRINNDWVDGILQWDFCHCKWSYHSFLVMKPRIEFLEEISGNRYFLFLIKTQRTIAILKEKAHFLNIIHDYCFWMAWTMDLSQPSGNSISMGLWSKKQPPADNGVQKYSWHHYWTVPILDCHPPEGLAFQIIKCYFSHCSKVRSSWLQNISSEQFLLFKIYAQYM